MAKHDSIEPFPSEIDRDAFGYWLSGFTDGEGCFGLWKGPRPNNQFEHVYASFAIALRADDLPILKTIQSYWSCGRLVFFDKWKENQNWKPQWTFHVTRRHDQASVIVPHFQKYPLRAKKARDFLIWSKAVALLYKVQNRRTAPYGSRVGAGWQCKWSPEERQEFTDLMNELKSIRKFDYKPQARLPTLIEPLLFD